MHVSHGVRNIGQTDRELSWKRPVGERVSDGQWPVMRPSMVTCNEPAATAARHIRGGLRDSLHLSAIAAIRWNPGIAALDRRLKHGGEDHRVDRVMILPKRSCRAHSFKHPRPRKSRNFHGKRIILTEVLARVVHECARQALQTCISTVGQAVENLWKTCLRRTHQSSGIRPGRAGLPPWMLRVVPTLEQIPLLHGKCGCETRVALPRASALRMHEQLRGTGGWSWRHSGGTGTSARGIGPAPAGPGTGFGRETEGRLLFPIHRFRNASGTNGLGRRGAITITQENLQSSCPSRPLPGECAEGIAKRCKQVEVYAKGCVSAI